MRYILALVLVSILASESQACHRSVAVSRFFAAERMVARAPVTVASAPFRLFSGRDVNRSRVVSKTTTPKFVVVSPCSASGCPVPKKVEAPKKVEEPKKK